MANKPLDKTYLLQSLKDFFNTILKSKPATSGGIDECLVTTGEKYNWNGKADLTNLAPIFDPTISYSAGDCVIYNNAMYKFNTAHPAGPWTGIDVAVVNFGEEIDDVKNTVENFVITLTKAEYDALSYAEKHDPNKVFYVTDYDSYMNYVELDDTTTALDKVWSSSRVVSELDTHIYQKPIELTKDEYDALSYEEKHNPNKLYYVTDFESDCFVRLDDNNTAIDKVWSSQKITNSITQANTDKYSTNDLAKTSIDNSDTMPFYSSSLAAKRKISWSNIKTVLKTYFDNYYNKVTSLSQLSGDSTHRTVTDTQISAWNDKLGKGDYSDRLFYYNTNGYNTYAVLSHGSVELPLTEGTVTWFSHAVIDVSVVISGSLYNKLRYVGTGAFYASLNVGLAYFISNVDQVYYNGNSIVIRIQGINLTEYETSASTAYIDYFYYS